MLYLDSPFLYLIITIPEPPLLPTVLSQSPPPPPPPNPFVPLAPFAFGANDPIPPPPSGGVCTFVSVPVLVFAPAVPPPA